MNQGEAIKALMALATDAGETVTRSKMKKVFVRLRDQAGYTDEQAYVKLTEMFHADHSVLVPNLAESGGSSAVDAEVFARHDRAQWEAKLLEAGVPEEKVKASRAKWDTEHPTGFMATKGRGPSAEQIKLDEARKQVAAGRKRMQKIREDS